MKAQASLELLLSLLAIVSFMAVMISVQNQASAKMSKELARIGLKMEADEAAAYCSIVYLNWGHIELNYSLELEGFEANRSAMTITKDSESVTAYCLSPSVQLMNGRITVTGEPKWF